MSKYLTKLIIASAVFISGNVLSETLCANCQVDYLDSELVNGDLRFSPVLGSGTSGTCKNKLMTTMSNVTERQRDQILSVLLTAAMSGAKVSIYGASSDCGSFNIIRLHKN